MARLPLQVPIPRPRPEGFSNIPPADVGTGPSVAASSGGAGLAITSPQQVEELASAVQAPAADPRVGGVPPADDAYADPYWGAVAEATRAYRPSGESGLAAGLQGFVNSMAAADRIKAENARQRRSDAREDERYQWAKEDRALDRQDRAQAREAAAEERSYRRGRDAREDERADRQFALTERAANRADEAAGREAKAFDYDLLAKGVAIEAAMRKIQDGSPIDATDMKNLADGERAELQNLEDDMELPEEQKSRMRAEIRSRYARARGVVESHARAGGGEGGSTDVMQKADRAGNPGAISGANEAVGEVPPADDEGPGFFGEVGQFFGLGGETPAAASPAGDPAARKPSEVFAKAPKFSGKGTEDDPLVIPGEALSKEQMEQVMFLHMKPGQWVLYNGQPIQRVR